MKEPGELDPREAAALRALRRDAADSSDLEERTVERLRAEGLVGRRRTRPSLAWAAVVTGAFLAGIAVGEWGPTGGGSEDRLPEGPAAAGGRYVLLLREGPSYRAAPTPEAERDRVAEYAGWARGLSSAGRFVDGEKLSMEERVAAPPEAGSADDAGPISGYFVIEAGSYEEAVRIARESPHVRHGGVVEVRPIEDTGP